MSLFSENSAVEPVCRHQTEDKESGSNEMKLEADAYEGEIAEEVAMGETTKDGNIEDSCPQILKTSAVVNENQCETKKMEGGGKKGKTASRFKRNTNRHERKPLVSCLSAPDHCVSRVGTTEVLD